MPAAPGAGPVRPMERGVQHSADEGLGRSQGGLTTKFPLACDGKGRPPAHAARPAHRGQGYSYPRCCQLLRQRQIRHTIPERSDQRARRAAQPGRPLAFDRATYARRNVVERYINRLKQWRGLATRHEKRALNYRAMVVIASIVIWLQS